MTERQLNRLLRERCLEMHGVHKIKLSPYGAAKLRELRTKRSQRWPKR